MADGSKLSVMHLSRFAFTRRHAALVAVALGVMAVACGPIYSEWRESEFRSLTPMQHYFLALRLVHPRTVKQFGSGKDAVVIGPWIAEPSRNDLKAAIHHLEAIPADNPVAEWASRQLPLPLLRLKRDRPRDFLVVEEAMYRSCIARRKALEEEEQEKIAQEHPCRHLLTSDGSCVTSFCGTGVAQECAPLAGNDRIAQLKALVPVP